MGVELKSSSSKIKIFSLLKIKEIYCT